MYVLVTYDVATSCGNGERRLRRVAKLCTQYGQRVQASVFECLVEPGEYEQLKHDLSKVIDLNADSLRFYNLGRNWQRRVESMGVDDSYDPQGFVCV